MFYLIILHHTSSKCGTFLLYGINFAQCNYQEDLLSSIMKIEMCQ